MAQQRLSHIAMLHIYKEEFSTFDTATILSEFVCAYATFEVLFSATRYALQACVCTI
jgi:hypothetical protein